MRRPHSIPNEASFTSHGRPSPRALGGKPWGAVADGFSFVFVPLVPRWRSLTTEMTWGMFAGLDWGLETGGTAWNCECQDPEPRTLGATPDLASQTHRLL